MLLLVPCWQSCSWQMKGRTHPSTRGVAWHANLGRYCVAIHPSILSGGAAVLSLQDMQRKCNAPNAKVQRYGTHLTFQPRHDPAASTQAKNTLVGRATTDRSLLPWTAQNKHVQDLGKVRRGSRRGGHVCTSVRQGLARAKSTGRSGLDGLDGMCTVSLRAYAPPFPTHCSSQHTSNHMGSAGAIAALQQAMWRAGQRSNDLLHALALSLRVCISDPAQPRQASRRWPPSRAGFFAFVDHLLSFYPRTPPPWSSWLACSVSGSSTLAMAPR